jgi:hypothetical protein
MSKEEFHTVRYPHPEKRNMFGLVSKAWPPPTKTKEQLFTEKKFQPTVALERLRLKRFGLTDGKTSINWKELCLCKSLSAQTNKKNVEN